MRRHIANQNRQRFGKVQGKGKHWGSLHLHHRLRALARCWSTSLHLQVSSWCSMPLRFRCCHPLIPTAPQNLQLHQQMAVRRNQLRSTMQPRRYEPSWHSMPRMLASQHKPHVANSRSGLSYIRNRDWLAHCAQRQNHRFPPFIAMAE